jgi:DNA-binding FadR family transcriptional regulator
VTAPAPRLVGEGIADMLRLAAVDPADVTEARMVLEIAMLDLACARATAEDLEQLGAICDVADAVVAAGGYDPELSAAFHARLAQCTHNRAIAMCAESFQHPLVASLRAAHSADAEHGRTGAREHRALVDALEARDAGAARAIMAAHLGRTAARVGVTPTT